MNCPKCNAELKPGARFCHVCGFDTQSIPTPPPAEPTPVYNQPTYTPPPAYNQNYQAQGAPAVDFSKIPVSKLVLAGVAFVGVISTFLPLAKGTKVLTQFQGSASLLLFLAIIAIALFAPAFKMDDKAKENMPKYISYIIAVLALSSLISFIGMDVPFKYISYGFWINILISLLTVVFSHNIIKME